MERHERLRLFVALLLPDAAVSDLFEWQQRELVSANVRIVPRENASIWRSRSPSTTSDVPAAAASTLTVRSS